MDDIIKSLSRWAKGKKGYPTQAQIHLTNYCNLKCSFCPTRALLSNEEIDRKKELKTEDWLNIIDQATELGVIDWHLCGGGEPMFYEDTALAVMNMIKEYGKHGEMITNGTLFDGDAIKNLVEIGWDKIFFSLDAPIAEIHDDIRGVKCFDKIIENIELFDHWKRKLKTDKPRLCFHMVVCNKNYKEVPDIIILARKLNVQDVLINALNIWAPEIESFKLNEKEEKELQGILEESLELAEKNGVNTNIPDFLSSELFEKVNVMDRAMTEEVEKNDDKINPFLLIPCYYPWYNISIFSNGITQPCFIPKEKGENVLEKSLEEIWSGEFFENFRKDLMNNTLSDDCSKCNPWNLPKMSEIRRELRKIL
ncbi:MAG: radical SAM protein [Candidatus Aenigmarchaeota archaeon]|nr:radical SAM protein [Candidatus Aenigmarchaeota archaeon]